MHHALVSYQDWPEYERIIGGRYPEVEEAAKVALALVTFCETTPLVKLASVEIWIVYAVAFPTAGQVTVFDVPAP